MKRMMIVCALLAVGCDVNDRMDAGNRALEPGSEMMVVRGDDLDSRTQADPDRVLVRLSDPDADVPFADIKVGTKVRVVEDLGTVPGQGSKFGFGTKGEIKVLVLEGDLEGKVVAVERPHLRLLR